MRLRYLRRVAPRLHRPAGAPNLWFRVLPIVAAVIAASFCVLHAMAHVDPLPPHTRRIGAPVLGTEGRSDVWQVEEGKDFETYSNGLRIDSRFAVSNHPRSYRAFPVDHPEAGDETPRNQPVGIVFHTTESHLVPFEPEQNRVLKKVAESLVEFIRRNHSYNFLIDRFGRVYRIVNESDAANHAGYSIWADAESLYVNLNESFLGVSFEAKTEPGQEEPAISPAQARAAAMLVEMLRSRYSIRAQNCVTHAQVSVNPSNMRVGYHTDWASSFPFAQLGLPDNYAQPIAALTAFGFESDSVYLRQVGPRLYAGVELAEERLRDQAVARGLSVGAYRRQLQRLYRERFYHPSGVQEASE